MKNKSKLGGLYYVFCNIFQIHNISLWLCIKRIHDQQFVKETAFYCEQLLFQIFTILAFLSSKPPNFNWKLLAVIHRQTKNWLFISDLYTQPQTWRVQTFLFCNISHPTEYFVRLIFLSKKPIHRWHPNNFMKSYEIGDLNQPKIWWADIKITPPSPPRFESKALIGIFI